MKWKQKAEDIQQDPAASYWLKEAVKTAFERDPVDALSDAEQLVLILDGRLTELMRRSPCA